MAVLIIWPNNSLSETVGRGDESRVRYINPFVRKEDLVVTAAASPVGIPQGIAIAQGAASLSPFGFWLLEPLVHFWIGLRIFPTGIAS